MKPDPEQVKEDMKVSEEDEEEDLAGRDASRVLLSCPDIRPYEKSDLREKLQDSPVWEGLELPDEIEGFKGKIKDTEPTSGDGFGEAQVIITKDTNIRIE